MKGKDLIYPNFSARSRIKKIKIKKTIFHALFGFSKLNARIEDEEAHNMIVCTQRL